MVDMQTLAPKIIKNIQPLKPDKIILFGSFANGTPTEQSDIDLFLIKDTLNENEFNSYSLQARKYLRELILTEETNGIDILSASSRFLNTRDEYFYKIDILQNGKVLYERNSG
jgi:predicted nucleotidyltransferase